MPVSNNATPFKPPTARAIYKVNQLLIEHYGTRTVETRDPLDGLILIILSQATNDVNCDRAFRSLKDKFPTWDAVLTAPVQEIAEAIRFGGLANQKAARIQEILRQIKADRGTLDLSWMHGATAQECTTYLSKFHGVGPKTIACVLVFFLNRPAFPVDTHVHRVTKRLGWVRPQASAEVAHEVLEAAVPDDCKLDLHVNLIAHGRAICRAEGNGGPRCSDCFLRPHCAYGKNSHLKSHSGPTRKNATNNQRDTDFFVTLKARPKP